MLKPLIEDLK
jgi:hypothetical protein